MFVLLALLCANPDLESARLEFLTAAKAKADGVTDAPAAERIRKELGAFLADDRKVPTSPHLLSLRDKYVAQRALWRAKHLESLPESERAETVARWEKEDEAPPIFMRRKWLRPEGALLPGHYFAVINGKEWGEHNDKNVIYFRWQESRRTLEYVELTSKRGRVRLYEGALYYQTSGQNLWDSAEGNWAE